MIDARIQTSKNKKENQLPSFKHSRQIAGK